MTLDQLWMSFPEIGQAHARKLKIRKICMSFPVLRSVETEISENFVDEFYRIRQ